MTSGKRLLAKVAPYARLVKGIAHPYRLSVLYLLSHEPMSPQELLLHLPVRQNLLAHHLKAMHDAGWLKKSGSSKYTTYVVDKKRFKELPQLLFGTPFWRELTKTV